MPRYSVNSPCIDGNTIAQPEDNIIFRGKQLTGEFFEDREDAVFFLNFHCRYYDEDSSLVTHGDFVNLLTN